MRENQVATAPRTAPKRELDLAFYWMLGGLLAAFLLVALRMKL